jgi:Arc/MetJ-type ribon-helix-helix transcriptional regulator
MTITVRLPRAQQAAIARLAKARRQTKSHIVRSAIELLLEREAAGGRPKGAYETVAHLIGCADSGGKKTLSESTGRRFAALTKEKARARRPSRLGN